MTWCPRTVTGLQLPAFAAAAGGLFADHGLEVEFVPAARAPDHSLAGFSARVKAVAAGYADFALTAVAYLLAAQTEAAGTLPVRFIAAGHQRNPIVAVVRDDSGRRAPADLAGARTARWSMPWFAQEYAGALRQLGIGAPAMVDVPGGLDAALGSGAVDVLPVWMDETTPLALQGMRIGYREAAIDVRVIALALPVYASGLVAADRVPADVARSMRDAFVAGSRLQRERPQLGLAAFAGTFPDVCAEHARANWDVFDVNARSDGALFGAMRAARWRRTIAYTARTHGLAIVPGDRMYRPELLTPAPERVAA